MGELDWGWIVLRAVAPLSGGVLLFYLAGRLHVAAASDDEDVDWPRWTAAIDPLAWLYIALLTGLATLHTVYLGLTSSSPRVAEWLGPAGAAVFVLLSAGSSHQHLLAAKARAIRERRPHRPRRLMSLTAFMLAVVSCVVGYWAHVMLTQGPQ